MRFVFVMLLGLISAPAQAGQFADILGAYLPNGKGECRYTKPPFGMDILLSEMTAFGICIPHDSQINDEKGVFKILAFIELTDPDNLDAFVDLELQGKLTTVAYRVQVKKYKNNTFELVDGSILKKDSSRYVGYIGYNEKAILYIRISQLGGGYAPQWKLCVNRHIFNVEISKLVRNHHSKRRISGKTPLEIEDMSVCH